jgi:hypothetical protein
MSTAEKSVYLKECLKTIGLRSPRLSGFIQRSLRNEEMANAAINRSEEIQAKLERLEAEILELLLTP